MSPLLNKHLSIHFHVKFVRLEVPICSVYVVHIRTGRVIQNWNTFEMAMTGYELDEPLPGERETTYKLLIASYISPFYLLGRN